jgi:hypothetical protein
MDPWGTWKAIKARLRRSPTKDPIKARRLLWEKVGLGVWVAKTIDGKRHYRIGFGRHHTDEWKASENRLTESLEAIANLLLEKSESGCRLGDIDGELNDLHPVVHGVLMRVTSQNGKPEWGDRPLVYCDGEPFVNSYRGKRCIWLRIPGKGAASMPWEDLELVG